MLSMITCADTRQRKAISYSVLPRADRFGSRVGGGGFWKPAVEASGLSPLRPHDLRHTAVALWIAAGATPREIATRAGHTSVVTVLDRYGHLFPDSEQKVNAALDVLAKDAGISRSAQVVSIREVYS